MDQLLIVYRKGSLKNKTLFCGKKDLFVERDLFYGRHSEFRFSCRSKQIKFFQQKADKTIFVYFTKFGKYPFELIRKKTFAKSATQI